MRTTMRRVSGASAIASFARDVPLGGTTAGASDSEVVLAATVLRHAVSATRSPVVRKRLFLQAAQMATQLLEERQLARGCAYDAPRQRTPLDTLRLLAEVTESRGNVNTAENILDALVTMTGAQSIERARVTADLARNSWKRGEVDLALAQYQAVEALAKRLKSPELEARALLGNASIAQIRGNLPAMFDFLTLGTRLAEAHGLGRLAAAGLAGLGIVAGMRGELDQAVAHLWRAYCLSDGDAEAEFLANLSEAFLVAGHAAEARRAAAKLLASAPAIRFAMPALGGFAKASAVLGDPEGVLWATEQVARSWRLRGHSRDIATATLDCAVALTSIGESARAGTLRRRALALAEKYGFHDIAHMAERTEALSRPAEVPFTDTAAEAANEFNAPGLSALPPDLVLATS